MMKIDVYFRNIQIDVHLRKTYKGEKGNKRNSTENKKKITDAS